MSFQIKGMTIGEGQPLICVPVMGETEEEIVRQASHLIEKGAKMIEWRVDAFAGAFDMNALRQVLTALAPIVSDTILVYTFRSKAQGGLRPATAEELYDIHQIAAETDVADMIDVEFFASGKVAKEVRTLQKMGARVIASHHDFDETPDPGVMQTILEKMAKSGADIVKLAVMPKHETDVLSLLFVTTAFREHYPTVPCITMSMGSEGVISRVAGEWFGSCVTFGAGEQASAPGQLPMEKLQHILDTLHEARCAGKA